MSSVPAASSRRLRVLGAAAPETRFDRALQSARRGLEGVLFVMARESSARTSPAFSVFLMLVDLCQLLVFPLSSRASFPWSAMSSIQWLVSTVNNLNPRTLTHSISAGPALHLSFIFLAAAWIGAIIASALYCAYSFNAGAFSSLVPLHFLRTSGTVTTAVLFMPLATLLIEVYICSPGADWQSSGIECFSASHLSIFALFTLLLLFFLTFALIVSAVFFDRDYAAPSVVARSHGRVSIIMILIKTTLTLAFTIAGDSAHAALLSLLVLCGLLWVWAWLRFLPMYHQWVNQLWVAGGSLFLWASVCAVLGTVLHDPTSGVAGYVFICGVPTSVYCGYALAHARYASFARYSINSTSTQSVFDLEIRARHMLQRVMFGPHASTAAVAAIQEGASPVAVVLPSSPVRASGSMVGALPNPQAVSLRGVGHGTSLSPAHSPPPPPRLPLPHKTPLPTLPPLPARLPSSPSQPRATSTPATQPPPSIIAPPEDAATVLRRVDALFSSAAASTSSHSALLHFFHAHILSSVAPTKQAPRAVKLISTGLTMDPSVDVRFLMQHLQRRLEEGSDAATLQAVGERVAGAVAAPRDALPHGSGSGDGMKKLSIIEQVQFDKTLSESVEHSLRARSCELAFWAELRHATPQLRKLLASTEALSASVSAAMVSFSRLLTMQPNSVEVLQLYGVFLLQVRRDTAGSAAAFEAAEDVLSSLNPPVGGGSLSPSPLNTLEPLAFTGLASPSGSSNTASGAPSLASSSSAAYALRKQQAHRATMVGSGGGRHHHHSHSDAHHSGKAANKGGGKRHSRNAASVLYAANVASMVMAGGGGSVPVLTSPATVVATTSGDAEHKVSFLRPPENLSPSQRSMSSSAKELLDARRRSRDSSEALASQLRAALVAREGVMEPSLLSLLRVVTTLFLACGVLFAISVGAQVQFVAQLRQRIAFVRDVATQQLLLEDCLYDVSILSQYARGLRALPSIPQPPASVLPPGTVIAQLDRFAESFVSLQRSVFTASSVSDAAVSLYVRQSLSVYDFSSSANGSSPYALPAAGTRTMGLNDLVIILGEKLSLVASMNVSNVTHRDPNVFFVLVNGALAARSGLNASALLFQASVQASSDSLGVLNYGIFFCGVILVASLAFLVVLPIIGSVLDYTEEVFSVFLALPDDILARMEDNSRSQLVALDAHIHSKGGSAQTGEHEALNVHPHAAGASGGAPPSARGAREGRGGDKKEERFGGGGDAGKGQHIVGRPPPVIVVGAMAGDIDAITVDDGYDSDGNEGVASPRAPLRGGDRASQRHETSTLLPTAAPASTSADEHHRVLVRKISSLFLPRSSDQSRTDSSDNSSQLSRDGPTSNRSLRSSSSSFLLREIVGRSKRSARGVKAKSTERSVAWSAGMAFQLLLRFLWPFSILMCFFGGLWRHETLSLANITALSYNAFFFSQVDALLAQVAFSVDATLASTTGDACNVTALALTLAYTQELGSVIDSYGDALMFGSSNLGVVSTTSLSSELSTILLSTACGAVNAPPQMPADCAWYNGVLRSGLQAGLREALSIARLALAMQSLAATSVSVTCSPLDVSLASGSLIDSLGVGTHVYLRAGLSHVRSVLYSRIDATAASFLVVHAGLTTLVLILSAALYSCTVVRAVHTMDRDTKRARMMLLLFPPDVLASVTRFLQMGGVVTSGGARGGKGVRLGLTGLL